MAWVNSNDTMLNKPPVSVMPQRFLNLQEKLPSLVTFWIEEIYISVKKRENCWQDMLQAEQFARIWAKFSYKNWLWFGID